MTTSTEKETLLKVTLRAEGQGPPVSVRWRRFLKASLRGYGLRATKVEFIDVPARKSAGKP